MADAPELDLPARKTALRAELRRRRLALSPRYRRQAALALARHCRRWLRREHTLAAYLSHGSEIDTRPLLSAARARGCRVLLPVVPARGRRLRFTALDASPRWRANRYGIPECLGPRVPLSRATHVLLPLLGFDAAGRRLGQGGGFYDATLAALRARPGRAKLIGLAYAAQRLAEVPCEAWDQRLDAVVTEHGVSRVWTAQEAA